jgi:hypothetical protein
MKCPHTWFSTGFHSGKGLLKARIRDLFRPAPRRGRAVAVTAAALALFAGTLVACKTVPAESSSAPLASPAVSQEELIAQLETLAPAALGLPDGSLSVTIFQLDSDPAPCYILRRGDEIAAEAEFDQATGQLLLYPATGSTASICLTGPDLPQGALDFRDSLPALVEQYTQMDPQRELDFFYLGEFLNDAFPPVWGFRAVQRSETGWTVLDDWYQLQESKQVLNLSYSLGGLLSYIPDTYRFPPSFSDPASRFYPELDQRAWALAPGENYAYREMTLTAAHYFASDDPAGRGYDGAASYFCPLSLPEHPGWQDETPYAVYLHKTADTYVYLGHYSTQAAETEQALTALGEDYFQRREAAGWDTYLNTVTPGNYFDADSGTFTSDALHFTWELPDNSSYYVSSLIFREVEDGLAVYHRASYERYVSEHGGVEPTDIQPGSGCLLQILAGPEDPYPTLPAGRQVEDLGGLIHPGIPGGNGWYYLAVSDLAWQPRSEFWSDYQLMKSWITSRAIFILY